MAKTILIVDDRPEIVQMIQLILEKEGYATIALNAARNVVETMRKETPDLLLLDIMMPDKDGYQICDEIRCDDAIKHIPIIVLTGKDTEKELIDQAYETYGATDYLKKPFEPDELLEKIRKHLAS